MKEEVIKSRIFNFHSDKIHKYVKRDINIFHIKDMVTTIVGCRKSGKTYLTYQIIDEFIEKGIIDNITQVCYLHFDDEILSNLSIEELSKIDNLFISLYPQLMKENIVFVFDEIHKIDGWENLALRLQKKLNYYVIVTGSTSNLEEDKVGKQLRGKTFTHKLYPLSFKEFILFQKEYDIDLNKLSDNEYAILDNLLERYIKNGSFPAIATLEEFAIRPLLQNYFNSIIVSDFIFAKKIKDPLLCKTYIKNLLQKNGCPYTHKKETNNLKSMGNKITSKTIVDWFNTALSSYFLSVNNINTPSIKKIEQNYRKIYCIDWGIAKSVSVFSESRISRSIESIVYWQLIRSGYNVSYEIVGNDKYEIDFIVSENDHSPFLAIQVTLNLDNPSTLERETRGFELLKKKYPNIENVIITKDFFDNKIENIKIITLINFLLRSQELLFNLKSNIS